MSLEGILNQDSWSWTFLKQPILEWSDKLLEVSLIKSTLSDINHSANLPYDVPWSH